MDRQTERHVSPALRRLPPELLQGAPLTGIEAKIYDRLWRTMAERKLRPGTKLREDVIGDAFGVSRTVVRKILIILEQEGVVDLPVNRGAFVTTPTATDAQAIHEAFAMVVSHLIGQLVAPDAELSAEQQALLDEHIEAQTSADVAGDVISGHVLAGEFWILLAAIHGNAILAHLVARLFIQYVFALILFQRGAFHGDRAKFQREVVKLIIEKKHEKLAALVNGYLSSLRQSMVFDEGEGEVDLRALLIDPSPDRAPSRNAPARSSAAR